MIMRKKIYNAASQPSKRRITMNGAQVIIHLEQDAPLIADKQVLYCAATATNHCILRTNMPFYFFYVYITAFFDAYGHVPCAPTATLSPPIDIAVLMQRSFAPNPR